MTSTRPKPTTTDAGIPVESDEHSLTVGPDGPIMTTTRPPSVSTPEVPSSFRYFANRDTERSQRLMGVFGRFVSGPLALPDDVATELGRDRARADPLSDAFIDAAFDGGYARGARRMVDRALDHGIAAVPDAPAELIALFEHLDREPEWLDWDRVERGATAFRRYGWTRSTTAGSSRWRGTASR